jgi:hypothetical protein
MSKVPKGAADILVEQGWVGDEELSTTMEAGGKQWLPSSRHWFSYDKCDRCQRTHLPVVEINTPRVEFDITTSAPPIPTEYQNNHGTPFTIAVQVHTKIKRPSAKKRFKQHYCLECLQLVVTHLIVRHIKTASIEQVLTVPDPMIHSVAKIMMEEDKENAQSPKLD